VTTRESPLSLPSYDVRSSLGEVRSTTNSAGKRVVEGYAAVFNSRSQVLYSEDGLAFVETIKPGTFLKSLQESDVRGLLDHDKRFLLGRRGAGTLQLGEDTQGLEYKITLGSRSYDRDLEESLERRDIIGSSFGFATIEDAWMDGPDGLALRELRQVHLFDVGPVAFPAYRAATATCRSLKQFAETRSAPPAPSPTPFQPTPDQLRALNFFRYADL
jgi:uncharacterized protein